MIRTALITKTTKKIIDIALLLCVFISNGQYSQSKIDAFIYHKLINGGFKSWSQENSYSPIYLFRVSYLISPPKGKKVFLIKVWYNGI